MLHRPLTLQETETRCITTAGAQANIGVPNIELRKEGPGGGI